MSGYSDTTSKYDELTKMWLEKGQEDILWAQASLKDGFYAGACFVSEQAAEKALKAYLFCRGESLMRTHLLPKLLKQCCKFDSGFEVLIAGCEILTYYYTDTRYPDDVDTQSFNTEEKAEEAIEWAKKIVGHIGKRVYNIQTIRRNLKNTLTETNLAVGTKKVGKVRDRYELEDKVIFITTDRQSAFDRVLAAIPFKGQVLNQISAWWFERTRDIIPNHVLAVPDPNVTVGKKCAVFPVEFVVRGYITGTTSTSAWVNYQKGARDFCGNRLPEGLRKNQKFDEPIVTPTTKDDKHDRLISGDEIIQEGLMSKADWEYARGKALELFAYGQKVASERGLILVDTKYEFGRDAQGNILLIDEIHTPDSSRYWIAGTYEERFSRGEEPENIDKEFLRLWFVEHCDPYNDTELPSAPAELVVELSRRFIQLYEMITGENFQFPEEGEIAHRISKNVVNLFG